MSSRKELLATIAQQREQIVKYEAKLRDVVQAYKGLLKEKEALQASLSILSNVKEDGRVEKSYCSQAEPHGALSIAKEDGEGEAEPESGELAEFHSKIATLSLTLSTLTSEKSRIEASFQNDKRRLLSEKEKISKQLESSKDELETLKKELNGEIQSLKGRLIVLQHERDQDTNNNAAMVRELEHKLSHERTHCAKLEATIEEMREQNSRLSGALSMRNSEQQQKRITDLQNELEQVRCRLKRAEKQCEEPPILRKLQEQMKEMQNQHAETLAEEHSRAEKAEKSLREISRINEDRVAQLEARLAELSFTVANYDKTRQKQQSMILTLKDELLELTQENSRLSKSSKELIPPDAEGDSVGFLQDKLVSVWNKLQAANLISPVPFSVEDMLEGCCNLHLRCEEKYDQLKEEFENYKMSSVQNEKTTVDASVCTCGLHTQVEELRNKLRSLSSATHLTQEAHMEQVADLNTELSRTKAAAEAKLQSLAQESRVAVGNLEQQLADQRQHSLSVLKERDDEIIRLMKEVHDLKANTNPSSVATALLAQIGHGLAEGPLLHHLEEMARKDLDIGELRRKKHQLENTMREIQTASLLRQQNLEDVVESLREEVERYKRNRSRTGENMEYLKNIVLQYMVSPDAESRHPILKAISAVLKFTPEEMVRVQHYNNLWWWQSATK